MPFGFISIESKIFPCVFSSSGIPEVAVCGVISLFIHFIVEPVVILATVGTQNFSFTNTSDPLLIDTFVIFVTIIDDDGDDDIIGFTYNIIDDNCFDNCEEGDVLDDEDEDEGEVMSLECGFIIGCVNDDLCCS